MSLINDVDLLLIEPSVFTNASAAAVRLLSASDATIVDNAMTSASATFDTQSVGAGNVVVVDGLPLEVVTSFGQTSLTVSGRREPGSAIIKPGNGTSLSYEVLTFAPLIEESELWLDRVLGLDPEHPTQPLSAEDVLNYDDFASLIALRTVAQAFARTSAADPENLPLREQSELYARLGFEIRQQLVASIDLDGDGIADERRRLAVGTWVRV